MQVQTTPDYTWRMTSRTIVSVHGAQSILPKEANGCRLIWEEGKELRLLPRKVDSVITSMLKPSNYHIAETARNGNILRKMVVTR